MKKIIGITGGMASGKTTLVNYLRSKGFYVLEADEIYGDLFQVGTDCYNDVLDAFPCARADDIQTTRANLRRIVFDKADTDNTQLKKLNAASWQYILDAVKTLISAYNKEKPDKSKTKLNGEPSGVIFLSAAVLYEMGLAEFCNKVINISASKENRMARLAKHKTLGADKTFVKKIIESQLSESEREKLADITILNNCSKAEFFLKFDKIWEQLLTLHPQQ
ncbi:MAG: dephospho-CoA kinase [Firmicutes bacterium]|nr:dephospho-CoA kinase [Bacillota bacterium]